MTDHQDSALCVQSRLSCLRPRITLSNVQHHQVNARRCILTTAASCWCLHYILLPALKQQWQPHLAERLVDDLQFQLSRLANQNQGLDTSLKGLAISPPAKPKNSKVVADSWEEAASASSSRCTSPSPPYSPTDATPGPPPPTPISPTQSHSRKKSTDWSTFANAYTSNASSSTPRSPDSSEKRPEKSSAAAGRLIAGALGVKLPKKTEENKAYERAVRETERKRREVAKEGAKYAEREKEEARRAIWEG